METVSCFFLLGLILCCKFLLTPMKISYMLWCSCVVFIRASSFGLQKFAPAEISVGATLRLLQLACGYICTIVSWRSFFTDYVIVSLDLFMVPFVIVSPSVFVSIFSWPIVRLGHSFRFYLYIVATR